jgi:hypothetical protein
MGEIKVSKFGEEIIAVVAESVVAD